MRSSGIYAIECVHTGERYVGSAVNVARRWERHRCELKKRRHHSWKLQRAWNKHGEEAFRFIILEAVNEKTSLLPAEQRHLDESIRAGKSLNVLPTAGSPLGARQTPESCAKRAQTLRGHYVSEETKLKISTKAKGRKVSEETRKRMSEAKKNAKRSEKAIKTQMVPIKRLCPESGEVVEYQSIKSVKAHGFTPSCVSGVLAGRLAHHRGFLWQYATEKRGWSYRHTRKTEKGISE